MNYIDIISSFNKKKSNKKINIYKSGIIDVISNLNTLATNISNFDMGYASPLTGELKAHYDGLNDNTKEAMANLESIIRGISKKTAMSLSICEQNIKKDYEELKKLINDLYNLEDEALDKSEDDTIDIEELNKLIIKAAYDNEEEIPEEVLLNMINEDTSLTEEDKKYLNEQIEKGNIRSSICYIIELHERQKLEKISEENNPKIDSLNKEIQELNEKLAPIDSPSNYTRPDPNIDYYELYKLREEKKTELKKLQREIKQQEKVVRQYTNSKKEWEYDYLLKQMQSEDIEKVMSKNNTKDFYEEALKNYYNNYEYTAYGYLDYDSFYAFTEAWLDSDDCKFSQEQKENFKVKLKDLPYSDEDNLSFYLAAKELADSNFNNEDFISVYETQGFNQRYNPLLDKALRYFDEDHMNLYYYLYENEGKDSATKYLETFKDSLNKSSGMEKATNIFNNIVDGTNKGYIIGLGIADLEGVKIGTEQWFDVVGTIFDNSGDYTDSEYAIQYVNEMIAGTSYLQTLDGDLLTYLSDNKIIDEEIYHTYQNKVNNGEELSYGDLLHNIGAIDDTTYDKIKDYLNDPDMMKFANQVNNKKGFLGMNKLDWLNSTFGAGVSVGNMLPPMLASFATSGVLSSAGVGAGTIQGISQKVGLSLMFLNSFAGSKNESIRDGRSLFDSYIYGVLSGSSEVLTEKFLGGIPGLSDIHKWTELTPTSKTGNIIIKSLLNFFVTEPLSEITEEELQQYVIGKAIEETVDGYSDIKFDGKEALELAVETYLSTLQLNSFSVVPQTKGVINASNTLATLTLKDGSVVNLTYGQLMDSMDKKTGTIDESKLTSIIQNNKQTDTTPKFDGQVFGEDDTLKLHPYSQAELLMFTDNQGNIDKKALFQYLLEKGRISSNSEINIDEESSSQTTLKSPDEIIETYMEEGMDKYSDLTLRSSLDESDKYSYDKSCLETLKKYIGLASTTEQQEVLSKILLDGGYEGFGFNSNLCSHNNKDTEFARRLSMATLYCTNPETFMTMARMKVNMFHGTNSSILSSILENGLNSVDKIEQRGESVSTGEFGRFDKTVDMHNTIRSRDFVSFTDIFDLAYGYSTSEGDGNFPVVIGTTTEDINSSHKVSVGGDVTEVGVKDGLPVDKIKTLLVPKDKVEFVQKMLGDKDIKVLSMDGYDKKAFYKNDDFVEVSDSKFDVFEKYVKDKTREEIDNSKLKSIIQDNKQTDTTLKLDGKVLGEDDTLKLYPGFDMRENKLWENYNKEKFDSTFKSVEQDGVTYYIADGEKFKFLTHVIDSIGPVKENGSNMKTQQQIDFLQRNLKTHPELFVLYDLHNSNLLSCSTISNDAMQLYTSPLRGNGNVILGFNENDLNKVFGYFNHDAGLNREAKPIGYNESVDSLGETKRTTINSFDYDEVVISREGRMPDYIISPFPPGDPRNTDNINWAKAYGIPIVYINTNTYIQQYQNEINSILETFNKGECLTKDDYQRIRTLQASIGAISKENTALQTQNLDKMQLKTFNENQTKKNADRIFDIDDGTFIYKYYIEKSIENKPSDSIFDAIILHFDLDSKYPNLTREEIVSSLIETANTPKNKWSYSDDFSLELKKLDEYNDTHLKKLKKKYIEFADYDSYLEKYKLKALQWFENLSFESKQLFYKYTRGEVSPSAAKVMNPILRGIAFQKDGSLRFVGTSGKEYIYDSVKIMNEFGISMDDFIDMVFDSAEKMMKEADKFRLIEPTIIYRGVNWDSLSIYGINKSDSLEQIYEKLTKTVFYRDPGFMSSTPVLENKITTEKPILFKLHCVEGTPVIDLSAINPGEREVLFPPGVAFHVDDVILENGQLIVNMTSVPSESSKTVSDAIKESFLYNQYSEIEKVIELQTLNDEIFTDVIDKEDVKVLARSMINETSGNDVLFDQYESRFYEDFLESKNNVKYAAILIETMIKNNKMDNIDGIVWSLDENDQQRLIQVMMNYSLSDADIIKDKIQI